MINLLRRLFIKDYNNTTNSKVRDAHGKLAAFVGIFSNLVLFAIKLVAGLLTASLSIMADSINNLSDMGSSVVTLIGFKMAEKPADKEHPYGHERMEYIAGLVVSIIVIFVGGTLLVESVKKIIGYEYVELPKTAYYISIGILSVSILVKIWQSIFNKKIGKLINSVALQATAADSRNDVLATTVVLIGTIVVMVFGDIKFSLDGVLGICVALFIIVAGTKMILETCDPLIGNYVPEEDIADIIKYVKSKKEIFGVHDVICHKYGPTKTFMTLHAEVDAKCSLIETHEVIDDLENEIREKFNIEITIHMDPIDFSNPETNELRNKVFRYLHNLDTRLSMHDFRIVPNSSKGTVLFDVVLPYDFEKPEEEVVGGLTDLIKGVDENYIVKILVDRKYVLKESEANESSRSSKKK